MSTTPATATTASAVSPTAPRTLQTCCGAHIVHDGLSDVSYVLLPLLAGFAMTWVLRAMGMDPLPPETTGATGATGETPTGQASASADEKKS